MFYGTGEERTKEDFEMLLQEINAYRYLDGESFDFGNGLIENNHEFHYGSEDAYLEMDEENIKEMLESWNKINYWGNYYQNYKKSHKIKKRLNRYECKKMTQKKAKNLTSMIWWATYYREDEGYYKRCYESGRKKYAKYCTNRKVRHRNDFSLKCGGYRKVHDYWWDVF